MGNRKAPFTAKLLSEDELDELIEALKQIGFLKSVQKLKFVKHMYQDFSVLEAAEKTNTPPRTAYRWLKRWNDGGPNNLLW